MQKFEDLVSINNSRPLSPHLTIYRPQLTSVLSILHRITGAYLYLGIVLLAWTFFSLVYFPNLLEDFMFCLKECFIANIFFKSAAFAWIFSLYYHLTNGIRHLFWDAGFGFSLKNTYNSGKIVVITSLFLTCFSLVYAYKIENSSKISEQTMQDLENSAQDLKEGEIDFEYKEGN